MTIEKLREVDTYWYLASPYSKYPAGLEAAFRDICKAAGYLINNKVPIFCPIAHSHPISMHGNLDALDHDVWLPADKPFFEGASGIIVCKMDTWEKSYGINYEIEAFRQLGKPIWYMSYPDFQLREYA